LTVHSKNVFTVNCELSTENSFAMTKLEIATTTLEDALAAQRGGADSIEISRDLSVGGLTPPLEIVQAARHALTIDIHAIVRPHARDFYYSELEMEQILRDARAFAALGVGVVFGAHMANGQLDLALIQQVAEAARGVPVTLHRALDSCSNPDESLRALAGIIPRALTSGPAPLAWEGRDGLRRWVTEFGRDFRFVASGAITLAQLRPLADYTGVHEVHLGGAARTDGAVDASKVARLRDTLIN
jgi:copper homeostasis protein